jgi:hypothetical protein
MLVRGGELPVQLCSENLSGLWRIGRWHVGIQQRGSGHASYAARSRKILGLQRGVDVVSVISPEAGWSVF